MWQFLLKKHALFCYAFNRVTVFKALKRKASVNGGAHTCHVGLSDVMHLHCAYKCIGVSVYCDCVVKMCLKYSTDHR